MDLLKGAAGGIIGGLIGGTIWALIAYYAHYEIGWIAWGIGALVGFGMAVGSGGNGGAAGGGIAIIIALSSIVGGKYFASHLMVQHEVNKIKLVVTDEMMIMTQLEAGAAKLEGEGKKVAYKNGKNADTAETPADYPDWMVKQVKDYYEGLNDSERASLKKELQDSMEASVSGVASKVRSEAFSESFGAMDILFGVLAILTAWRVGSSDRA